MPPNPPPPRRSQQQHHPVIGGRRNSSNEEAFQEVDPTGRFGRYAAMLGWAPSRRFDQEECIEVAWIRVRLRALDPARVDRRHAEVRLLRCLHRDHIIGFHEVWLDHDAGVLNFITEVCNSASLREYFDRHKHVSVKALKKWARASTTSTPVTPASSAATVLAATSLSTATPAM